jgi:hypothetical protein
MMRKGRGTCGEAAAVMLFDPLCGPGILQPVVQCLSSCMGVDTHTSIQVLSWGVSRVHMRWLLLCVVWGSVQGCCLCRVACMRVE